MRKSVWYSILAVALLAGAILAVWSIRRGESELDIQRILAVYREDAQYGGLALTYPLDGTLFPPEIIAPTFQWEDRKADSDAWLVTITFADGGRRMSFPASAQKWTPPEDA